jgi:hypothetical protein
VLEERPQFLESALGVEGNAGPALSENERLRVLGDAFQKLDVSPVASSISAFQFFRISAFTQLGSRFPSSADAVERR